MASQAVVLLFGLDTLIVNVQRPRQAQQSCSEGEPTEKIPEPEAVPEAIINQVSHWLDVAKNAGEPLKTTWEHEKRALLMYPNGTPTHRYLLKNGLIDLMLEPLLNNGTPARVRFSSEYLWRRGVDEAVINTHAFLRSLFNEDLNIQPSEMHVCADVMNLQIPRNYERVFVSRAAKWRPVKASQLDKPVYRYHRLETLQFSGHGNPVSVSIYDKHAEIEQHSQEKRWFYDLWKSKGWNGTDPVWRVECRLKREALHEMDIEEMYQALEQVPALWAYCVGCAGQKNGWVRMVVPNPRDSNRRRWRTAGAWVEVQNAFKDNWRECEDIEAIQRERKRQVNLDRAEKAIAGYTTTYGAWLEDEITSEDDASVVLQRLYEKMVQHWEHNKVDFHTLRRKKQFVYHLV